MTKFEKGVIISVIVIMIGMFIGVLCLMLSHYHDTNKKPVITISKSENVTIYSIKFYDDYAVYLSETNGVTGMIENENKRLDYKSEIDLKDVKSKLKATSLSSGDISVSIEKEEFFISDDSAVLKELLQSVGKEKLEG